MTDKEMIGVMERSIAEIEMLRRENDRLRPKADAYDSITAILGLLPQPPQGFGEDIVWGLRKKIEELQPKPGVCGAEAA